MAKTIIGEIKRENQTKDKHVVRIHIVIQHTHYHSTLYAIANTHMVMTNNPHEPKKKGKN